MNAYQILGLEPDADERAIKRAYSGLIKQYRPDTHPAEFAQIRVAYEDALHWLRSRQQWEEQQAVEASVAEPVAPAPAEMKTPSAESMRAAEQPVPQSAEIERNTISIFINQLEEYAAHANESATLDKYREQAEAMAMLSLDQQMDFEQALFYWMLVTEQPSLLVFEAANARYGWLSNSIEIGNVFGARAADRFFALNKLSKIYSAARQQKNPFLQFKREDKQSAGLIAERNHAQGAQKQVQAWQRECANTGLIQLAQRINLVAPRAMQIFWADIIFAGVGTAYSIAFVRGHYGWAMLLQVLVLGLLLLPLPCMMRGMDTLIQARLRKSSNKELGKTLSRVGWAAYVIIIFVLIGGGYAATGLALIMLGIGLYFSRHLYQLFVKLEALAIGGLGPLRATAIWLKHLVLAVGNNRNTPYGKWQHNAGSTASGTPSLEELKMQLVTSVKNGMKNIRITIKATPAWAAAIVIWMLFKLVVVIFARN